MNNAVHMASDARTEYEVTCRAMQRRCVEWGAYWRAPDAHGVSLSLKQATELLRDALGVEVEIKPNNLLLLLRAEQQIRAWHAKYGKHNPGWLPPAGDVYLLEDIETAIAKATA